MQQNDENKNIDNVTKNNSILYKPMLIAYLVAVCPILGLILTVISPKLKDSEKMCNITVSMFLTVFYLYFIVKFVHNIQ